MCVQINTSLIADVFLKTNTCCFPKGYLCSRNMIAQAPPHILIADSGSTKTHWVLTNGRESIPFFTAGINPFYTGIEEIKQLLLNELVPNLPHKPSAIFFYGAGLSQPDNVQAVGKALQALFPAVPVGVEHDLLAAARATCRNNPGIACILGTGSNSCLYDGEKITDNIPSLGFFLGDEGSGASLGRKLLQAYFYRELPDDLRSSLEQHHDMNRQTILNAVYHQPLPNRFVASFSRFLTQNNQHPAAHALLYEAFSEFIQRHVCKYAGHKQLPVHFIGSVAKLNESILTEVLLKAGLTKGLFLQSPMEGLIAFHSNMQLNALS
ncbi:MAG: ATPase [Chitinophagales bacterium]|nr:MAG: ATPase [Chitinophagales bacterium]